MRASNGSLQRAHLSTTDVFTGNDRELNNKPSVKDRGKEEKKQNKLEGRGRGRGEYLSNSSIRCLAA